MMSLIPARANRNVSFTIRRARHPHARRPEGKSFQRSSSRLNGKKQMRQKRGAPLRLMLYGVLAGILLMIIWIEILNRWHLSKNLYLIYAGLLEMGAVYGGVGAALICGLLHLFEKARAQFGGSSTLATSLAPRCNLAPHTEPQPEKLTLSKASAVQPRANSSRTSGHVHFVPNSEIADLIRSPRQRGRAASAALLNQAPWRP